MLRDNQIPQRAVLFDGRFQLINGIARTDDYQRNKRDCPHYNEKQKKFGTNAFVEFPYIGKSETPFPIFKINFHLLLKFCMSA